MSDQRVVPRKGSIFYLKVVDEASGEMLGRLVDISSDGFKLVSAEPVTSNNDFKLVLELPESFGNNNQMFFNAKSLYSKKDVNPDFYNAGFKFENLSSANRAIISQLMTYYIFETKF